MTQVRLNYYWRLFATFLSFSLFGLGGIVLSLIFFPVLYILPIAREWKIYASRYVVRLSFRLFIGFMRMMGVLSYDVQGGEVLQHAKGSFIVANHPTLIDIVFLVSLCNLPNCVVKQGVWNNPVMFFVVRAAGFIQNNGNPEDMLIRCEQALQQGDGLILFPEGTRTDPGGDIAMKRGVAHIALRSQKNLQPVTISCSPITLTKKHRWYQIPLQKCPHFCIMVGDEINVNNFLDDGNSHYHRARELTQHLKRVFKS